MVGSVVLITCDTLRSDRLGVYGCERQTSPSLDRFARESVVFDSAYASAALTKPALSALMTGRLPDELGMTSNKVRMSADATTIAELASRGGIRTHAIVSNWVLRRRRGGGGLEQGFDGYDDLMEDAEVNRTGVKERRAAQTTDAAIRWVEAAAGERFFLWVHYQDPHGPYTPPPIHLEGHEWPLGTEPELPVGVTQRGLGEIPEYQVLGAERHPDVYRARYEAEIRYFDHELGRFLEAIELLGLLDEALIVFTADHGESLGEHDYWFSHGRSLYRELVHVPFIVRYPAGVPAPATIERDGYRRTAELVAHLDVLPTIVAALGLEAMASHGTSLLTGGLPTGRVVPQDMRRGSAVSDGRYRLVQHPGALALFDIQSDPGETVNLAERFPERVRDLQRRRATLLERLGTVGDQAQEQDFSAAELDELRKLGYLGDGDQ